jgi:hypothetical protein
MSLEKVALKITQPKHLGEEIHQGIDRICTGVTVTRGCLWTLRFVDRDREAIQVGSGGRIYMISIQRKHTE